MINLSDLGEVRVTVDLVRPDGRKVAVPLRTLTEQEVWQIQQALPTPKVPVNIEREADGKIRQVPQPDNPDHVKALSERGRKFQYRLILASLAFDVTGDTDEDKTATLQKVLGAWAVNQLQRHILRMTGIEEAEVKETAGSFPGV